MKLIYTRSLLLLLPLIVGVICRSVELNTDHQKRHTAIEFMKKFGYLQPDTGTTAALYTDESLSITLKEVQKYGAIPQSGILDDATLALMSKPRCGLPDKDPQGRAKRFILGPSYWKKRNISYFVANAPYSLGEERVRRDIRTALEAWSRYSNLQFQQRTSPDADIVIAFASGDHADSFPFDGPGGILAHAYFPEEYGSLSGDVHFDADETWTKEIKDEGTHFLSVAVHELGHSLGLFHSPDPDSVMFPYYRGTSSGIALGYDDVLAMYELYIKRRPQRYEDGKQETEEDQSNEHNDEEDIPHETTEEDNNYSNHIPYETTPIPSTPTSNTEEKYWITTESYLTFEGDNESVETHKNHNKTHKVLPKIPDICDGNVDAVATLRSELFIFKDKFLWRLIDKSELFPGYPIPIRQMFPLPEWIEKIDAAYERPDGNIVIFVGKYFWIFNGGSFIEGSPLPLTFYGLPQDLDRLDAVQIWAKNGKTYMYRGDRFWRYNEITKRIDDGYPKHMYRWNGVPLYLDAANTWKDNITYFFKGKMYWKFDNDWVRTTELSPLPTAQIWLGCPKEEDLH